MQRFSQALEVQISQDHQSYLEGFKATSDYAEATTRVNQAFKDVKAALPAENTELVDRLEEVAAEETAIMEGMAFHAGFVAGVAYSMKQLF